MNSLQFTVFAKPEPQGSTRAFIPKGWNRAIITTDNAKLKPFRQEVAQTALAAMHEHGAQMAARGVPIALTLGFFFDKPKSVRKSVHRKTTKPDLDKLARAALDALTGIVYADDSQVDECHATKSFGSPVRLEIQVRMELP
jgi:crossover junction endodeoxyribonuclease RusA